MSGSVHMFKQLNRLVFSILLVGHKQREPGWQRKPRKQSFYSIWLITKGSGVITLDGAPFQAEPGKIFVTVPNMVHEASASEHDCLEYYFIRFHCALAYEENEQWNFAAQDDTIFPFNGMYHLQNPPEIINLLEQMHHLWQRGSGMIISMRRKVLFQELWLAIAEDFRAQKLAGDSTLAIERTIDYMVSNYKKNLTLDDLAHIAGLSVSHYSRLFKKYAGFSPIDYLTHLRMDRAKELLALSDYRLKGVAQSVGYHDEFYFSRTFKKVVGVSPSEFSQRHRLKRLR